MPGGDCDDKDVGVDERHNGVTEDGSHPSGFIVDRGTAGVHLGQTEISDRGAFPFALGQTVRLDLRTLNKFFFAGPCRRTSTSAGHGHR